ncbi:MAG: hypothetical protein L0Y72_18235 [Gemmataceae bacterium]|nr:hypothetical protein [Gemmataceae bacterium]MCI0740990.1 hypothetical protein [Gemmataceae bacterium]
MDRVHSPLQNPLAEMGRVVVAIKPISDQQCHLGILHRREKRSDIRFLNLQWHFQLADEIAPPNYHWIDMNLPAARAKQIAARCRQVWRSSGKFIPYGFSLPTDNFDEKTGEFLFGPTNLGLTCATFVLAVFEFASIRLLDYTTWRPREDDSLWQQRIVEMLEEQDADAEHVEAVRQTVGCLRFRPEEVAAGAALFPPTASFDSTCELATQILERLYATS